ncbi:MAG: DUF115 domain-containing protein [Firmicutes bacterium]|nr:DUF115 domain-containing protein [Bacillota bacterium]
MLFEKNRDFLARHYPFLLKELSGPVTEEISVEIEQGRTGLPVARVSRAGRKVYLNSPYDPELDARRWAANQFGGTSARNVLVCGGGFLYHIQALLELERFEKIIVYEPSRAVFQACLREVDLEPVCRPQVLLLAGADHEGLYKHIAKFLGRDFFYNKTELQIAVLPSYKDLFQKQIQLFQNEFMESLKIEQLNLATTNKYIENWLLNEFKNLRTISDTPAIRHFLGRFKNIPAIIVSAGPSLEKNVRLLNDVKEKALIICAGSSIRAMKRNGVSPHFQLAVDPHEINARLYNDLDLEDLYFLYCFNFYYGVVEKLRGKKIIFQTNAEIFPAFVAEKLGYQFGDLNSGFSCAHTCFDLAYLLGCNPIILIGQDLAYTGNKRYAEGHLTSHQKYLHEKELPPGCFLTKDIYGQDIITDRHLDGFRIIFETMFANMPPGKVQIINATEGGQPIKGAVNRKLGEVLAEYCGEDRGITRQIQNLYEQGLKELRNRRIDPAPLMMKLQALITQGIDKMEELQDRIQQLRKLNLYGEADFPLLDQILEKLCAEYDQALNYQEYHILLKQLQVTKLSVNKYRTVQTADIQSKEEYDKRLQSYLLIIAETQKSLLFINTCIEDSFGPIQPQVKGHWAPAPQGPSWNTEEFRGLKQKILQKQNPDEIRRLLDQGLKRAKGPGERSLNLYLYGLFLARDNQDGKAKAALEEAAGLDGALAPAYLLLGQLYYRQSGYTRAAKYLTRCRELGFKTGYCNKTLLKINYLCKDYVAVNNLLEEYQPLRYSQKLGKALKIECLARLDLGVEAEKEYQNLARQFRISDNLHAWLQKLLDASKESEYAKKYRVNLRFFKERGLVFAGYPEARYKVCRFLGGEMIYDQVSRKFLPGRSQTVPGELRVWLDDVLAVHDIDNAGVFERLRRIENEIGPSGIREQFRGIPVYIIDHDREHWQFIMQLSDFSHFEAWRNMRFFIGTGDEELRRAFLDETALFPTIIHGTGHERLEKFLWEVKQEKDGFYNQKMQGLKEYYQDREDPLPGKVLLVFNFQNEMARFYADAIKNYLAQSGIECRIYHETPPYNRFSPYLTARIIEEYRPDLVIGLGVIQEEIEALNEIPAPFASWLMAEKSLEGIPSRTVCPRQRLFVTGNLSLRGQMEARGYPVSRIQEISLPAPPVASKDFNGRNTNDIGIVAGLIDVEETLNNLAVVICGVLSASFNNFSGESIIAILKAAYFKLHADIFNNNGLNLLENALYEGLTREGFARYGFALNQETVLFIAALMRRELENSLFNTVQARWVIENFKDERIVLYGAGWEKTEYFRPYHQEIANFFADPEGYRQLVSQNKINLYPGNLVHNNSYLQPDLLAGITAGGFYLVNGSLVKKYGAEVLKPFGGFLETYSSKEELVNKIRFYLENNDERIIRAKKLQDYLIENYEIEKVISAFLPVKA